MSTLARFFTLAVIIVRARDVILTETKSALVTERNSDTAVTKAVVLISVPELDPPAITVVKVSVTLVTACTNFFLLIEVSHHV